MRECCTPDENGTIRACEEGQSVPILHSDLPRAPSSHQWTIMPPFQSEIAPPTPKKPKQKQKQISFYSLGI